MKHENPTCESRFNLGTTAQVSYVFKRVHLAQWEAIDRDVREMIRNFVPQRGDKTDYSVGRSNSNIAILKA